MLQALPDIRPEERRTAYAAFLTLLAGDPAGSWSELSRRLAPGLVYWRDEAILDVGHDARRAGWLRRAFGRPPIRPRLLALGRALLRRPA